uniref:Uncharacterized protein n=1 Tax=Steinernema glaseri TaxID=37863 RepID=A0A1I8AAW4_9BILA
MSDEANESFVFASEL